MNATFIRCFNLTSFLSDQMKLHLLVSGKVFSYESNSEELSTIQELTSSTNYDFKAHELVQREKLCHAQ